MNEAAGEERVVAASPGAVLRAAREARKLGEREVAERLHWVPEYVALIEKDDYLGMRSPSFARGYVRSYGRLLAVNEEALLLSFDTLSANSAGRAGGRRWPAARDPVNQRNGLGMAIGLATLCLLVLALWWLRGSPLGALPAHSGAPDEPAPGVERATVGNTPAGPVVVGSE